QSRGEVLRNGPTRPFYKSGPADEPMPAMRAGIMPARGPALSVVAKLHVVQRRVQAAGRQELLVRPLLDDLARIEDDDAVGVLYRGQAMRDHQGGAAAHQAFERRLH